MTRRAAVLSLVLVAPAVAQPADPVSDFADAVFAATAAQAVALACPTLSLDFVAASRLSDRTLGALGDAGVDPATLPDHPSDPYGAIAAAQDAFRARHGLVDGADAGVVCAAGAAEIADRSGIGILLVEVESEGASR